MLGIRLRFMDLLYAAVIGNSLQALHPNSIDALFIFGICLLLIVLEDFFLYYADVAPENPASEGISFFGMLSEIAILTAWFFAFQAFARDSWTFVIYLLVFFGLKIIAGFLNCLVSKNLWSLKFFRELMFFISVGALAWILWKQPVTVPSHSANLLVLISACWFAQTLAWWGLTAIFRHRERRHMAAPVEMPGPLQAAAEMNPPVEPLKVEVAPPEMPVSAGPAA